MTAIFKPPRSRADHPSQVLQSGNTAFIPELVALADNVSHRLKSVLEGSLEQVSVLACCKQALRLLVVGHCQSILAQIPKLGHSVG